MSKYDRFAPRFTQTLTFGVALLIASPLHAQTSLTWADAGTDFATGANWIGGSAPADSVTLNTVAFNGTDSFQPTLGASRSVAGLVFNGTGDTTLSGPFTLTLGASGIVNTSATGMKIISANLALSTAQIFTNVSPSSTGGLYLTGSITNGGNLITLSGAGTSGSIGNISGSGGLTKTGSGRWTLTGSNNYSGPTNVEVGTLEIVNYAASTVSVASGATVKATSGLSTLGGLAGSGTLNLNTSSEFRVGSNNADTTFSGNITTISYYGIFSKVGFGTLTLTGDSTNASTLWVRQGTVSLGAGGASGAYSPEIKNDDELIFNHSDSLTYNGYIYGIGSVVKTGSGTLTFTDDHTYNGNIPGYDYSTFISAGALSLGNGGESGSVTGRIRNNSTLIFNRSDLSTLSGDIYGIGNLRKIGSGPLILTGNNSYTGSTSVDSGVLSINGGGTYSGNFTVGSGTGPNADVFLIFDSAHTASITGNISLDHGNVIYRRTGDTTYAGILSGSGGYLSAEATGTLTFTGNHPAFTAETRILTGTLSLGNGGTTGSLGGPLYIAAAGNLALHRSDDLTFTNAVSGLGSFTKRGTNTVTLGSTLTYTGATIIEAGTLALGAANRINSSSALQVGAAGTFALAGFGQTVLSLAGEGTVNLGLGTLIVAGNSTDSIFSGAINGQGGVFKTGSGTLILSGPNTYFGGTTIENGTLSISSDAALGDANSSLVFFGGTLRTTANFTTNRFTFVSANSTIEVAPGTQLVYNGPLIASDPINPPSLNKTGTGNLVLNQGFEGNLIVSAGTLTLNGTDLVDSAALGLATGTTLNLNHSGTDLINALYVNGIRQTTGTWGALGSSATHQIPQINGSGLLLVGSTTPLAEWLASYGLYGADASPAADPDLDGLKNSLEFILGGNPITNDSAQIQPLVTVSGGYLTLSFKRRDLSETDQTLSVEVSENLSTWTRTSIGNVSSSSGAVQVTVIENDTANDDILVQIPMGSSVRLFARLKTE